MAERFLDFELKENSENQNTEKSTSTRLNVWTSWAEKKNFETNLLAYYKAKQLENKHMNGSSTRDILKSPQISLVQRLVKLCKKNISCGIYPKYHYKSCDSIRFRRAV